MLPFFLDFLIFKNSRWIHNLIYLQLFTNQRLNSSFIGLLIGWNKRVHVFCSGKCGAHGTCFRTFSNTFPPSFSLPHFAPSPAYGIFEESYKQMRSRCVTFAQALLTCNYHASHGLAWQCLMHRATCFIRWHFSFPFLLIFHKSCQDAQESFCGLPCGSWGCQRIKYKIKLLFFPFHTRAIHSTERDAAASPRAPWRAVKYWYSN